MNIQTLSQSKRRRLLVLLLPVSVALLVVVLAIGTLTVLAFGDLQVTFSTAPPATINAGESYSFAVEVTNNASGQPDAEAVVFEYRPPPDVAVTSISSSVGSCEAGTKNDPSDPATCALGNMATGASETIDITVLVDETVLPGTMLDNDVRAWQFGTEDDPPDNENHAFVQVILGPADMRITKFGKPDGEVRAGEFLTYTVIIDNLGPSVAPDVVVTDTLVSSGDFELVAINQIDRPGAACSPTPPASSVGQRLDITCQLASLEPLSTTAGSGRWTIEVVVTADETQDINNVAEVTSSRYDPDTSNNLATVEHDITDVSDLEITKASVGQVQIDGQPGGNSNPQSDNVTAGLPLVYTIVVTNTGPSTAENVEVQDRLPPGIVVRYATPSTGNCDTGTPGEPLDKLTCGLGTMPPGRTETIVITADVSPSLAEGTILENDVLVFSDIFDPDNTDNFDHNLTTVNTWADLGITKSARGDNITEYNEALQQFIKEQRDDEVTAGELLQYTLVVTNTGPSDAQNVVFTDTLPPPAGPIATVHFVSADGADCRQDPIDRNELTCELGTMAVDEVRTVYILVQVDPAATDPTATESPPANNTEDILNVARVFSDTKDPYDGPPPGGSGDNNTATNTTTVNAVADIFITKVDVPAEERLDEEFEPDQAIAGLEHRYLITFGNDGPSVARDVVVTDTLDLKQAGILGETFVRCEPVDPDDEVTCSEAAGIVSVDELLVTNEAIISTGTGTLNPDDVFSFYLITKVDPGYVLDADDTGTEPDLIVENTAFISSSTTDVRTQNNQDTEQTEIIAEADLEVTKTDTPDPGLPDQYLSYDPVSNHFVFTYTLTVRNNGPSDAATVILTDTLPVDAEFLAWDIPANVTCVFRDDGTVFCLMGEDENNLGNNEPGRMNVGTEISFEIHLRVDADSTPRTLENRVEVGAVTPEYADVYFPTIPTYLGDFIPLIPDFLPDRRPTPDPNLSNNVYVETTTVFNAEVRIDKKAVVGRDITGLSAAEIDEICRTEGVDDFLTLSPAQITYCYFVYDEGDTWLTNVEVTDEHSANIVETVAGPFVNVIGRAGTGSEFNLAHALWASIEDDDDSEVAPLAPAGIVHPDGYTYLLAVRSVILDFADGGTEKLGSNTATVTVDPCTKYSTILPGVWSVMDDDLLHDTLALPVLEETDPEWSIYEDRAGDGLPSPRDVIEYVVDIPNTGIIEATGVEYYDGLYNYIDDDPEDLRVPGLLINGSVSAAIHVYGRDPVTGRVIDADVQPPDLAFGEDLLIRTQAPAIGGGYLELTYLSAIVLDSEILKGNNPGDDEVQVATRLVIPPVGYLLRFDGVTYDPPIPVTFSLRIRYRVRIKETKYVRLGTIVLNHGWVTYNEIGLFDQRFPDFDPANPDAHTAANKVANNHAGTPGRAWESPEFPGWPEIPVDVEPTDYFGPRFDDYAQPGAAVRDDDDPTWFKLDREPSRIQLPAIDHQGGWETQIQVQNAGDDDTGLIVFFWGEYSGQCPYSDPGPVGSACKRVLENGVWSLKGQRIPSTAKSAIVYSVGESLFDAACRDADDAVGDSAAWRDWEDDYEGTGEPIAVIVQREGPNDHDTMVSSTYPGISENMEGGGPPYQYFAPYAMRHYHDLDTEMIIHNSGQGCADITLEYQKQDDCGFSYEEEFELAPGESIRKRVPEWLGVEWLGSIYVEADEPLGIIIDQTSFLPSEDRGVLLTYEARPYKLTTDTRFYADLVWRELSGWETSIQVQNLTQHSQPTFVTVEFFDNSGDSILFLGDWVCPAGGNTFYLPAVTDLGMAYAGAAVIQSHNQVDYPGEEHDGQPIFAVVDLKKTKVYDESLPGWRHTMPGENQGGAYNALAEGEKMEVSATMLPFLTKARDDQDVTSLIAVRNNSNCNDIELELEVRKGTGTVVSYVTDFWLPAGHVNLIDLANVGNVNPGFVGAGTVEVTNMRQLCDTDHDGQKDQTPPMLSAVVVNKGGGPGDVTEIYEGIPFDYQGTPCLVTISGHIIDELTLDPVMGADVNGVATDFSGYYEFQVSSNTWGIPFTLDVAKTGYEPWSDDYTLYCDDLVVNPELYPECDTVAVTGLVEDKETGLPIAGADVWAANCQDSDSTVTDADGYYSIELDYDDECSTWVMAGAAGYNGSADSVFIPICDTALIDFQLHQTPKSRILLYWGNGGEAVSGMDYDTAKALFENLGYFVDYTPNWPTDPDLEEYKVIFLLGPGNANGDPASDDFTPGQVAQLDLFLRNGGRLVVMTEAGETVGVENNLVGALNDLQLRFRDPALTIAGALADDITPDQITTDVTTLDFDTATDIDIATGVPGELAELGAGHGTNPGADILAADTMPGITRGGTGGWGTGFAGDVVLIGDLDWVDDTSFMGYVIADGYVWPDWPADNENLLLNLIGF